MKPLAIYNIWDGEELLQGSIEQIKHVCDILLVYQVKSNHGRVNEGLESYLKTLGYPMLQVEPTKGNAGQNETAKRQAGIDWARDNGYEWFIHVDCDEYYDKEQFSKAWEFMDGSGYDGSVCDLITYITPEYRLVEIEKYKVPLFCKIKHNTTAGHTMGVYVDPTRKVNCNNVKHFTQEEIVMHHYTMTRKDLAKKLGNSTALPNFRKKVAKILSEVENIAEGLVVSYPFSVRRANVTKVDNRFGIQV